MQKENFTSKGTKETQERIKRKESREDYGNKRGGKMKYGQQTKSNGERKFKNQWH